MQALIAGGPASSAVGQDAEAAVAAELAGAEERALTASEGAAQVHSALSCCLPTGAAA